MWQMDACVSGAQAGVRLLRGVFPGAGALGAVGWRRRRFTRQEPRKVLGLVGVGVPAAALLGLWVKQGGDAGNWRNCGSLLLARLSLGDLQHTVPL